jgi:hypothetical protein
MGKHDQQTNPDTAKSAGSAAPATAAEVDAKVLDTRDGQGAYGSGGSYGVGGGFEDDRESVREDEPDLRASRAARSAAQQDGHLLAQGFEGDVEPDAAPHVRQAVTLTPEQELQAAKNRRGSRI